MFSIFLFESSIALTAAAPTTIAVPCWSSWKTGIFIFSLQSLSTSKQSGALISSKFIAPKVGSKDDTISASLCGLSSSTSISKQSIFANFLNRTAFPSITGLEAPGPIFPKPKTAVPLEITATKFPFEVYLEAVFSSSFISKQASATPGEYALERSL